MDQDSEYVKWVRETVAQNVPLIQDSAVFLAIFTDNYVKDAVPVLQFGLAVLLGKPIYLTMRQGTPINENIRRLARGIYEYTGPEDAPAAVQRAMAQAEADGFTGP